MIKILFVVLMAVVTSGTSIAASDSVTSMEVPMRIKIDKNTATIADDGSLVSKLITGCKGKVTVKTPFGVREIKTVRKEKSK